MSAVIDGHAGDGHAHGERHEHHPSGLMRWVTTTAYHKDIGTLSLWFSFNMFFVIIVPGVGSV
jgi:cytochrome c oxidase subunit 1